LDNIKVCDQTKCYYSSLLFEFILYLLFHPQFHNYFPHVCVYFNFFVPLCQCLHLVPFGDRNEHNILLTQRSVLRRLFPSLLWCYQTLCPSRTVLSSGSESIRKQDSINSVSKCKTQVTIRTLYSVNCWTSSFRRNLLLSCSESMLSTETSVTLYQPTRSGIPNNVGILQDRCENLKPRELLVTSWSELRRRIRFILCEDFCWIQLALDRVKWRR
jgi:hypothetical protein